MSRYNDNDIESLKGILAAIKQENFKDLMEMDFVNMDKNKIYFAGPWFNEKSNLLYKTCLQIMSPLRKLGLLDAEIPKETTDTNSPLNTFNRNVEKIKKCKLFVALVDSKDTGTAWEIGMAYAYGKPVVLVGLDETTFESKTNIMLAYCGKAIALKNLNKLVTNTINEEDYINFEDDWRNKE